MDENETASIGDLRRIEAKVDRVIEAINTLVLIEDRQSQHNVKLEKLDARAEAGERELRRVEKVGADALNTLERESRERYNTLREELNKTNERISKWLYMGTGAWAVLVILFEIVKALGVR